MATTAAATPDTSQFFDNPNNYVYAPDAAMGGKEEPVYLSGDQMFGDSPDIYSYSFDPQTMGNGQLQQPLNWKVAQEHTQADENSFMSNFGEYFAAAAAAAITGGAAAGALGAGAGAGAAGADAAAAEAIGGDAALSTTGFGAGAAELGAGAAGADAAAAEGFGGDAGLSTTGFGAGAAPAADAAAGDLAQFGGAGAGVDIGGTGGGAGLTDAAALDAAQFGSADAGVDIGGGGTFGGADAGGGSIGFNSAFSPVDEPYSGGGGLDGSGFSGAGTGGQPLDTVYQDNIGAPGLNTGPAAPTQGTFDKALGYAKNYGPLAMSVGGAIQGRMAASAAGKQIAGVGQAQRDAANGLLAQYNSGQLNAGDAASVQQFKTDALAKSRQYFAQAGMSNSSQAAAAEAQINQQAAAMQSQMLQGYLTTAMSELNITDANQVAGIQAELQGDQQATASAANFLNAYGSWLRGTQSSTKAGASA